MRKIGLFSVLKYLIRKIWIPLLCAAFGAVGMMMLAKEPASVWNSSMIYGVHVSGQNVEESYQLERTLADVLSTLLSSDEELSNIAKESEHSYSFSAIGRNVKIRVNASDEQSALNFQNEILEKAEDYLSREFAGAELSKEAEDMVEVAQEPQKKKYAALGALAGLCVGLCGLLVVQYLKSSKITE